VYVEIDFLSRRKSVCEFVPPDDIARVLQIRRFFENAIRFRTRTQVYKNRHSQYTVSL